MDESTGTAVLTILVAVIAVLTGLVLLINVWQVAKCISDWKQSGPASRMAIASWIVSVVFWFTGPCLLIGIVASLVMGIPAWVRSDSSPATRRAGRMAVWNTVWIVFALVIAIVVANVLFPGEGKWFGSNDVSTVLRTSDAVFVCHSALTPVRPGQIERSGSFRAHPAPQRGAGWETRPDRLTQ